MKLFNSLKRNPIIIFIIGFFLLSCSDKISDDEIVAKVGDRIITGEDFRISFELSFAPFRLGENPRKTYLDYMIKELLIANEGFSLGFNENRYVTSRVKNRLNNNLLQSFYTKYVHSRVVVPDNLIEEATKKATVKFRMIIWPLSTIDKANAAYKEASQTDLEDYVEKQISKMEMPNVTNKTFETDWLDFLDLRPELLAEIQDLEMGKPSEPIPYNDGYAIFQVISINRDPIKVDELKFGQRRKKIESRLFNIEADKIVHKVMDSVLTPLDVRAKSKIVDLMVLPLYSWVRAGIPETAGTIVENLKSASDTSKSYILELKKLLPET
ncbi:MAG: peptidyl-prolyl cis-trans isomerase, partial [Melioribacteraceae bacterium]|nr:peptidyl-prolyl cis-trans isomerase [Melioribacteraceae bacterium]